MGDLLNSVKGAMQKVGQALGLSKGEESDSPEASKAVDYIKQRWDELKNAYVVYHQAIWQAILFYANQSWIDWDDARKVWQPQQPNDEWVPRPRINRFSPTIDAVCSNFFQVPEIEVLPVPDEDPTAMQVANIANKYLDFWFKDVGLLGPYKGQKDKAGVAAQLFILAGCVFTIVEPCRKKIGMAPAPGGTVPGWDAVCEKCDTFTRVPQLEGQEAPQTCPQCGGPLKLDKSEAPGPEGEEAPVYEYSISCKIGNSLFAMPRPGSLDIDSSPFLLWTERETLDYIWFHFDEFDASPDNIWPDGYSVTYEHALNFWYTGYASSTIQTKDSCMVLRCYVAPGKVKDHPDGFYGVVINDKAAHYEDWQFPEHPLTMAAYLDLPTIFFARSTGFDLVEIQRELNAYESIIKLHAMTSASDSIVVNAGTMVSEITGRADKVIKWQPRTPNDQEPHRMESGHLDDGIYKQRDALHSEFQNISMAVNAFRGQQEGSTTAAAAISQLRGQAEQMFSKPQKNWATLWTETGRKAVKFAQKYLTYAQLQAICGPGNIADIRAFKQADLDKTLDYVASQHGLPRTREERKTEMMTMWDKGALDINQPEVRQRVYELFGETGMMKSFNLDATRARLENQAFKENPEAPINPMVGIEDLQVHLYIHTSRIKSLEFDTWPPASKQALMKHTLKTQEALEAQQMKQAQQALTAQAAADAQKPNSVLHGEAGARASAATPPKPHEMGQTAAAPPSKGGPA